MENRFMKYWVGAVICVPFLCVYAADVRVIRAADYGARPDDGIDDTPAIRLALEATRGKPSRVVFEKGTYDLYRDRANERYLFISNNDEGLKRIAFNLTGMKDLEIDGQGSEFMFNGFICPFVLDNSKNITLKNFSVDFLRTFHSEGKILAIHEDGVDLEFSEAFQFDIRNGVLVFTGGEKNNEPQTTVKSREVLYPYGSLLEFDAEKRETAYMAKDYWASGGIPARRLVGRQIRLLLPNLKATPGNILVFGAGARDVPGFTVSDSSDVKLANINLYHCGGMGVIAQRSRNIELDHFNVTPAPGSGRIISATADATHFVNCSGKITMGNCLFENQKDDATNIHGIYARVARLIAPDAIEVQLIHPQQHGFDFIVPGGKLELVHGASLIAYGEAIVKAVERVNKEFTRVTLSKSLPAECVVGDVVASCDGYPETWIHHCTIRNNRARGILLGSRAKMLIEDNVFHTPGAAILLEGDGRFWYEQAGVRDLVIRRNTFDNCNFGVWGKACIEVGSGIEKECRATSRYNRNIRIEDNLFRVFGNAPLLGMYSVDGLVFKGNRLERTATYPAKPGTPPHMFEVVESDNVQVESPVDVPLVAGK